MNSNLDDAITVRAIGSGRYRALYVPQTFALTPNLAHRLLQIEGISEAINGNTEIPANRREFLMERVQYWRKWVSTEGSRLIAGYFRE